MVAWKTRTWEQIQAAEQARREKAEQDAEALIDYLRRQPSTYDGARLALGWSHARYRAARAAAGNRIWHVHGVNEAATETVREL